MGRSVLINSVLDGQLSYIPPGAAVHSRTIVMGIMGPKQRLSGDNDMEGEVEGSHWEVLRSLTPLYQAITTMRIGNGQSTSFWQDVWHKYESMAERFPALYYQATETVCLSVQALRKFIWSNSCSRQGGGWGHPGDAAIIDQCRPTRRECPFFQPGGKLRGLYKLIKTSRCPDMQPGGGFWNSCAPPRVQFFAWLLLHGRVQCRANLHKRSIVEDATCELCNGKRQSTYSSPARSRLRSGATWAMRIQRWPSCSMCVPRPQSVPAKKHFDCLTHSCCCAAGSSGRDEMGWFSGRKRYHCPSCFFSASRMPGLGAVAFRETTSTLARNGVCFFFGSVNLLWCNFFVIRPFRV